MPNTSDPFLPTRWSLVRRLKDLDDQMSWREFFDTYWRVIHRAATRAGLSEQEAQDVLQETFVSVAREMPRFRAHPESGSFKAWLLTITERRVADQYRKRAREVPTVPHRIREETRTATVERMPDPASLRLEDVWEAEWERNLLAAALDRLKRKVKLNHLQAYDMMITRGMTAGQVAKTLKINIGMVYLIRHRVGKMLKQEVKLLRSKFE